MLFLLIVLQMLNVICKGSFHLTQNFAEYPSLSNATIDTLSEGLACHKFTSVDLVKAYLLRIAEVDDTFHAIAEINPDALGIAAKLDLERSAGIIRSPLHGIPVLLKDLIATNDRMNNTAGSWALLGAKAPRDATVVRKLRAAGAIILGKTNLSEWANFRSHNSTNGWSPLGGQVYGPYFPNQDPWGSSSGSGVAAALGMALGCLGTETDGSIIYPSSYNNLVGIKPTVGLTSRHMVIPVSEHQDTVGPMARTVKDAAYILQIIAGIDHRDNYTRAIPNGVVPDYVSACKAGALSGMRLGIPRNVISLFSDDTTDSMLESFGKALDVCREAGATIVEDANFIAAVDFLNSTLPTSIVNADFLANIPEYFKLLTYNPFNIASVAGLRDFTQSFFMEDYPDRDTGLFDQALQQGWNNKDLRFWPAFQQNLYYGKEGGLLGALRRHDLDAVILPSNFGPHFAAALGSPIVSVPLGAYPAGTPIVKNSRGLVESAPNIPFGISFLGARFTEEKLIGMAYAFEQKTHVRDRIQPYMAPNTELANVVANSAC